ncbi:MAG: tetratricopeptide repeat protein, partial [bacterium]|nr:tetratricopeptide repeat protein [bacterium]
PMMGWGVVVGWRGDRPLLVAVLGAVTLNLVMGLAYHRDPAGVHVFFLLLIAVACILLGVGLNDVERRLRRRWPPWAPMLMPLVCGASVVASNLADADHSAVVLPDAYGRRLLQELPRGAILLTDGDDASYIVDYLHRVEGVRPDVEIFHRMGRGSDLAGGDRATETQRTRRRRQLEVSLLNSGRSVHFVVPRMMPANGFEFVPQGLSYRATRSQRGDKDGRVEPPVRTASSPTQLLAGMELSRDPWVDKLAANCWYMEAEALLLAGDSAAAIDAYERAAQMAPESLSMNYNVSLKLLQANEITLATPFILRAIEIDPLRQGPYKLAAEILSRSGQTEVAREVHKRALEWGRIP